MTEEPAELPQTTVSPSLALNSLLDQAPLSARHWKIWLLCALGIFLDGFDLFVIAVALPLIAQDLGGNKWQLGMIGAAAPLGAMIGAAFLGRLTDRFGRKAMYTVDLWIFVVLSALCAVAWNPISLMAFRFLLGIGIGADYPIGSSYIAEFMPSKVRGKMLVGAFSFQALGALAGAVIGLAILLVYPETNSWRWMLAAGIVPALAIIVMRHSAPESARWLLSMGRIEEGRNVVAHVVGEESMRGLPALSQSQKIQESQKRVPISRLFERQYIKRTILALMPWFIMDVALYAVGTFTPTMLASLFGKQPHPGPHSVAHSVIQMDILGTEGAIFLDVFLVIGFAASILLIERVGRIKLQMFGFIGMAAGLLLLAIAGAVPKGEDNLWLVFAGFAIFNLLVNAGPNATTYLLPAELFPTDLRASGHGLASAAGKVGAVVGIFFLPALLSAWGLSTTMAIVAAASLLGFVGTWIFGTETAGATLEELSEK